MLLEAHGCDHSVGTQHAVQISPRCLTPQAFSSVCAGDGQY
ncbi:hypothetical protein HMPREF9622_01914 [Cutibacterium modestum HL037PA3]|nr:hypothetical protein HMPREF9622_01914 [Cutibacterium modestum HL037PA3]